VPSSRSTATARPTAPRASACSTVTDGPLAAIVGPAVVVVEAYGDDPVLELLSGERQVVDGAIPSRVAEFATTRRCARDALVQLGHRRVPILAGAHREPLWPDGVVGSLTHCAGYRAAAVTPAVPGATIGIDAEPNEPLPPGVLEVVTSPLERRAVARLTRAQPDIAWDRLLFSAKEAVYKAWFPVVGTWLGFEDVALTLGADSFAAAIDPPRACDVLQGVPRAMMGRWRLDADRRLLVTCVDRSG
jgi:4'-phosphopantetheinyl transferase EntD